MTLVEVQEDEKWMEAMWLKCNSIMKNYTWDLVDRPTKCKFISTKWVYKEKYKYDGILEKYKAHLVAKIFSQVEGFEFQRGIHTHNKNDNDSHGFGNGSWGRVDCVPNGCKFHFT